MNKLKIVSHLMNTNGALWFFLYALEKITHGFTTFFYSKRIHYETKNKLPGFNSVVYNYKEWSNYDWRQAGEEWSESEEWKKTLTSEVIDRYIQQGGTILEIGPGGGRWSESLAERSKELILVDLTEKSIEVCKQKLKNHTHCVFHKNNGTDLSFLHDTSVDYLWSFDVFVHIAPLDIELYLKEISRVLKMGAIGLIHHSTLGTNSIGFRSSLTNQLFLSMLHKYDLKLINQISSWEKEKTFSLSENDTITIFRK